ncbi:MAG: ARMT1-like domain-containing protein [Candidatus Nanopelagicales bacterium]
MELVMDCLPCLLRQALEAARMATDDESVQGAILDEAMQALVRHRSYGCAPELATAIHEIVKKRTGLADPYEAVKARDVAAARRLEPLIRRFAAGGPDVLLRALKVSATGNVMDSALYANLDIEACVTEELEKPFAVNDLAAFVADLRNARDVLIIGDNAGETVFDKVLAEELSGHCDIFFAVRDRAIINDVTAQEAHAVGMDAHATIVSTGCGAPGAILDWCSQEFNALFNRADIVISKGQGNFEALSGAERRIYFLLKAKCPRLANALGVQVGEYVFRLKPQLA